MGKPIISSNLSACMKGVSVVVNHSPVVPGTFMTLTVRK